MTKVFIFSDDYYSMVARSLDDTIRMAQNDNDVHQIMLTRRDFLKLLGFTALSIGTGVGFAGCSGGGASGQNDIEFKPPSESPLGSDYRLYDNPIKVVSAPEEIYEGLKTCIAQYLCIIGPWKCRSLGRW